MPVDFSWPSFLLWKVTLAFPVSVPAMVTLSLGVLPPTWLEVKLGETVKEELYLGRGITFFKGENIEFSLLAL